MRIIKLEISNIMTDKEIGRLKYLNELANNLNKFCYSEIYNEFSKTLYKIIPSVPIGFSENIDKIFRFEETEPRNYSLLYRARENEEIGWNKRIILPYKKVEDISIIPETKKYILKSFNRCNKPFEPRFYCSNEIRTACAEVLTMGNTKKVKETKYVTLGKWRIDQPLNLAKINYSEKYLNNIKQFFPNDDDIKRYNNMLQFCKKFNEHNNQFIDNKKYSKDYFNKLLELFYDEFAKIEINYESEYFLSNIYCDRVFNDTFINHETSIDGILYPSTAFSYQEQNLVLHPRAMNKISFINASFIEIVYNSKSELVNFRILENNIKQDNEGNIQWNIYK